MALIARSNAGLFVLALYLIVVGLAGLVRLPIPLSVTAILALVSGILLLVGR
jgi:hypothetical protein